MRWLSGGRGVLVEGFGSSRLGTSDPALYRKVNVPRELKKSMPRLQRFEMRDAPVVVLEQCTLRIYAGEVLGVVGPVEPEVDGTQLYVVDGSGAVDLPLDPEGTALVLVVQGTCTVAVSYGADGAFYAPPGGVVLICALAASSKLVVALGAPTADPVVIGGPFVMNSEEEVAQAYEDFLHGRFNATGGRSETVLGDSDSSAVE